MFTMFRANGGMVGEKSQKSLSRKERETEVKRCEFTVKKEKTVNGVCTIFGACKV